MVKNFTFAELIRSNMAEKLGINNTPTSLAVVENLLALTYNVLQPLRDAMGFPIIITSGYRCDSLNSAVGGARKSLHMSGRAADITGPSRVPLKGGGYMTAKEANKKIYEWLLENGSSPFTGGNVDNIDLKRGSLTELINEKDFSWIHVAL